MGRIRSAGSLLIQEIGKQANKSVDQLKPALKDIETFIRGIEPEGFVEFARTIIDALPFVLRQMNQFVIGFGQEAEMFAAELREAFGGESAMSAREFGRLFGKFMIAIIKLVGLAADVFRFFTTPVGKSVAVLGGFTLVAVKVVGAIAAIAPAIAALSKAWVALGGTIKGTMLLVQFSLGKGLLGSIASAVAAIGTIPIAIGAALAAAGAAIFIWIDEIKAFFVGLKETWFGIWVEIGDAMLQGLTFGLLQFLPNVINSVKSMGAEVIAAAKNALGIASPSKEFAKIGEQLNAGTAKGMQQSAPKLQSASRDSTANAALAGAASGARAADGAAGGHVSVPVTIMVDGAKDPSATAQEIGAIIETQVAFALERLTAPSPA